MAKSRGADAPPKQEKEVSTEKFLNLGVPVKLKSGETLTVRELSFANLVALLTKAATSLATAADAGNIQNEHFLTILAGDKKSQGLLHEVFAASTDSDISKFANLSASDGLRLVSAINQVNDFAEIFSVFQEMGLQKMLSVFVEPANRTK